MAGLRFIVVNTNPKTAVIITENTEITLSPKAIEISEEKVPEFTYEDIGGLKSEIDKIREMVELPLKHPGLFAKLGIEPPKGVLLHGPPGTGKTLLAKAVANESEANFILVNGPEVFNKFYGETEKKIRETFEDAEKNAPSIIFIDEIDAIAPKREESYGELERRAVSQLLTMMDGLKSRGKVVVIGATNRPNAVDPALRRPGRFDREISISVPNKEGRLNILKIHTRSMPLSKDVNLSKLAEITHGFVGADINALCKEAAMNVLRRVLPEIKLGEKEDIPNEVLEKLTVTDLDFYESLKIVRPSAMREVLIETPNIHWEDIGGLEQIKQELIESVEWPLKYSHAFKRIGIEPPKGLLLYGPPGTGKTLLAKAVAKESEANFILVNGPELLNKWVGESSKGIKKIFEKARQASPCIIFFDEIDSITPRRGSDIGNKVSDQMVNTLLAEIDGLQELNNVVVIGATNRPDIMDSALLRPGRFDRLLLVPPPNKNGRLEILNIHTKEMPLAKDVNLDEISKKTECYVGADLKSVCREAGILSLREDIKAKEVTKAHFETALRKVKPTVSPELMDKYKEIEEDYLKNAKAGLAREIPNYFG
jgi:transitional endoplasmic reticulum ATPase